MNRILTIIPVLALLSGCAFDGEGESSGSTEQEQTFGTREFPQAPAQRVDPGDIVDTDRDVSCSITVNPEDVTPPRTVKGIARSACKAQAAAQCSESEVDGVSGIVLYSGTALAIECDGYECTGTGIVQCLYNVGG